MFQGPPKREDVIRKTEIMRKINPENCDYLRLGQQNVWFQWAFIKEGINVSAIDKAAIQDGEDFNITLKAAEITNMGTKAAHLIDHYTFKSDPEHEAYKNSINSTDGKSPEAKGLSFLLEASK